MIDMHEPLGVDGGAGARYVALSEHEVLARETGLIWTRRTIGRFTWADALQVAPRLTICGRVWRVPTPHELFGLVEFDRFSPAINPVFECEDFYWTSRAYSRAPRGHAWGVGFHRGAVFYDRQDSLGALRLVRQKS